MASASLLRSEIESFLEARIPSALTPRARPRPAVLPFGIAGGVHVAVVVETCHCPFDLTLPQLLRSDALLRSRLELGRVGARHAAAGRGIHREAGCWKDGQKGETGHDEGAAR